MIANGHVVGDGSWDLRVFVTDLQTERQIRVKGDVHIGGVMLRLVEDLEISMDWSDHALWWPEQNIWLTRTRSTLDQCGVHADALLHFTPMHKSLRVQLPDLRYLDMRVDFSIKTFSSVVHVCKELGIRHPEELSFCKPLEPNHLKYNYKDMPKKKHDQNGVQRNGYGPADTNTFIANSSPAGSTGSLENSQFMCAPVTPTRAPPSSTPISSPTGNTGTWKKNGFGGADLNGSQAYSPNVTNSLSLEQLNGSFDSSLAQSPPTPSPEAKRHLIRPKSLVEKARMNVAWLDSSLSIMEQGVREHDTLCLRFKFYVFYDLNPKYDSVRINQIYEQAKWQLLNEEIDCTEEEMLMFAALQVKSKFGQGLSFATTAAYATHSHPDNMRRMQKVLILAQVFYGDVELGDRNTVVPVEPCYTSRNEDSSVYVKYDDASFYPAYIVHYKQVKTHKFGWGLSFATNSFYATHYHHDNMRRMQKVMILAQVFYGDVELGDRNTVVPVEPCYTSRNEDSSVYVKYDDASFYPAYIVHYEGLHPPKQRR